MKGSGGRGKGAKNGGRLPVWRQSVVGAARVDEQTALGEAVDYLGCSTGAVRDLN